MSERMLCAIPARIGSKRLARKNLLPLAGKPMLVYSIEAARHSGQLDEIFVCTDDEEIAGVARRHGASVPFLMPPELCGDLVSSHTPCAHLARHLGNHDSLICLQPSSPLRSAADIRAACQRFQQDGLDFLVSVTPIDPHYFHWAVHQPDQEEGWRLFFGERFMQERPLLPPVYRPNGAIKIARLQALEQTGHFFGKNLGVLEMPEERSVHVATRFDLELCEFLLSKVPA
jgi:CMP-N-acetylneuraminic acid synthetase